MADPTFNVDYSVHEIKRKRYKRRLKLVAFIFVLLICIFILLFYELRRTNNDSSKNQIGPSYVHQVGGATLFKSTYFQFSDTNPWVYSPGDSTPTKITFLLFEDNVPAHSLTVYVNQTPLQYELAVNHALPVQLKNDNSFTVGNLSDNCDSLYKPTDLKRIRTLAINGTNILCVPDSPQYTAVVGQIGGDYNLALKRSNGEMANYIIIYQNLSFTPDPTPFLNIMKTFQAL
jgi:hypothetical protein